MDQVRLGIIGVGGMGAHHVAYMTELQGATLTAMCDVSRDLMDRAAKGREIQKFTKHEELLDSGAVDAVLIATPHVFHCDIARAAFARGVHVLTEKPLAVSINDARKTIAAYEPVKDRVKFGIMYQCRTYALWQKARQLVLDGEIGDITRITWIVTNWFRTWAYYASGGWRATWKGEGGGALINQCPHNLDLLQWVPGGMMPNRVTAVVSLGKTHPIEVEDEVSAILEYPNGAIGHFITTTGEAPGTDRLEICGDRGKLVAENGKLLFARTRKTVREIREKSAEPFAQVETWDIEIPYKTGKPEGHKQMTQNFVDAVLGKSPMLADGTEGAKGLEIGNAMLMSGITRAPVNLPLDGEKYDALLVELAQKYGGKKTLKTTDKVVDVAGSFH